MHQKYLLVTFLKLEMEKIEETENRKEEIVERGNSYKYEIVWLISLEMCVERKIKF